ncbi:TcpQ domain-containing protein [Vibrio cholerae]|uniref:TcpQ domain-containing protein n=1 Tax=Vibrio cholerae TaxID=666 RepID=UPI000BA8D9C5|nr:TcpQ domain-containing protein [Vibrio cholerae]PAR92349.1 hypothetical protein CGT82_17165 [Vibrio cholerae]
MRFILLLTISVLVGCSTGVNENLDSETLSTTDSSLNDSIDGASYDSIDGASYDANWFEVVLSSEEDYGLLPTVPVDEEMIGKQMPNSDENIDITPKVYMAINHGDSLKDRLKQFLEDNDYILIWKTNKNIILDGSLEYSAPTVLGVVEYISQDIGTMGLDLHINVYKKNNVVLVYSVRG